MVANPGTASPVRHTEGRGTGSGISYGDQSALGTHEPGCGFPPHAGGQRTRAAHLSVSQLRAIKLHGVSAFAAPLAIFSELRNAKTFSHLRTMPRIYKCRKCGVSHESPTGKQCQRQRHETESEEGETANGLLPMMLEIKEQLREVQSSVASMKGERERQSARAALEVAEEEEESCEEEEVEEEPDIAPATVQTLRKDLRVMSQAARRLAQLKMDDSDEDDLDDMPRGRHAGKKSGSVMTPTDRVKTRIDWPHWHVSRVSGGRRKNVPYAELRIDEFVYGFMLMIGDPACKWDYRMMTQILTDMMQDSWGNAAGFYEMAALDVEKGRMKWSDKDRLNQMRMTYARTVFPGAGANARESKEPPKSTLQPAPANMRYCVPFQRHECEHDKDHAPFTHGCGYCFRARSALCRHPEEDCKRKAADTKNGRAGGN